MASSINKSVISKILNSDKPPTDVHGVYRIVMKRGKRDLAPASFIAAFDKMFPGHFAPKTETAPEAAPAPVEVPPSTECVTSPEASPAPEAAPATPAKKRGRPANPNKAVKPPKAVSTTPYRAGSIYDKLTLLCLANPGMSMNGLYGLAKSTGIVSGEELDCLNSFNAAMGVIRCPTGYSNRGKTECTGTNNAVHLRILSMTPTRPDRTGNMAGMTEEDKASWPERLAAESAAMDAAKTAAAAEKARKAEQDKATKDLRKAEKTEAKMKEKAIADAAKAQKKAEKAAADLKAAQDKVAKIEAELATAKAAAAAIAPATEATTATEATATAESLNPGESIPAATEATATETETTPA